MATQKRINIVFIIDYLTTQEGIPNDTAMKLLDQIQNMDKNRYRPMLFCLHSAPTTSFWDFIDCDKGILHVHSLASLHCIDIFFSFVRFLKSNSVDVVLTCLYDSTLFGILAAKIAGVNATIGNGCWLDDKILESHSRIYRTIYRVIVNSSSVKNTKKIF
jgi:hypothetical protein